METNPNLQAHNEPIKIWNRAFISAFVINMILHLATQMMNALLSKYTFFLGASTSQIGIIASLFAVTALIFKFVSAPAIDTFNRKYILMFAAFILTMAFTGYALSSTIQMVVFARLLQGVGQAFTTTCCLTIAADSLPLGKMSTGIGYFSLATAICQAIAPTFALKLSTILGYNLTFGVIAAITLIAIAFIATIKLDFVRIKKFRISLNGIIAKEALIPAFIMLLLAMAQCVIGAFLILYAQEIRGIDTSIGYYFTVSAVTLFLSRPLIGKLADRYGTLKVLFPSLLCFASAFILISFSTTLWMFLLAAFISAFGYGGCQPSIQAVAMKSVPKERRGSASCTSFIGQDLGLLIGSSASGIFAENFGYINMWRVMIIPMALAGVVAMIFRNRIAHAGETA